MKNIIAALILFSALCLALSACGAGAAPPAVDTPAPTVSQPPEPTLTPTAAVDAAATRQVEDFQALVQKYYDAGYIPSTNGKYSRLGDQQYALDPAGWNGQADAGQDANHLVYGRFETGQAANSFIIRANVLLDPGAGTTGFAGCGFAFRSFLITEDLLFWDAQGGVHYAIYTEDMEVREQPGVTVWQAGGGSAEKIGTAGNMPGPGESAQITLVVSGETALLFVGDELAGRTDYAMDMQAMLSAGMAEPGDMSIRYMVLSDASAISPVSCTFGSVELWTMDE